MYLTARKDDGVPRGTRVYAGRTSPGENARSVLAKLAYRFINYGMSPPPSLVLLLLSCVPPSLPAFVREPRTRASVQDSFSIPSASRCCGEEPGSFFSSLLASINLSSPLATAFSSARRLCTRACTQLVVIGREGFVARHYAQREGSNRKRILLVVCSSWMAGGERERAEVEEDRKPERFVMSNQFFAHIAEIVSS